MGVKICKCDTLSVSTNSAMPKGPYSLPVREEGVKKDEDL